MTLIFQIVMMVIGATLFVILTRIFIQNGRFIRENGELIWQNGEFIRQNGEAIRKSDEVTRELVENCQPHSHRGRKDGGAHQGVEGIETRERIDKGAFSYDKCR